MLAFFSPHLFVELFTITYHNPAGDTFQSCLNQHATPPPPSALCPRRNGKCKSATLAAVFKARPIINSTDTRSLPRLSPLSGKPEGSDSSDMPPPPELIATTLNQIITTVGYIADTVVQLGEQFDEQTEYIGRINRQLGAQVERIGWIKEQGNWWVAQLDKIKCQNACLEAHAESIQSDMGGAVECLILLLQVKRKFREGSEGAREGLGRAGDTEQNPCT